MTGQPATGASEIDLGTVPIGSSVTQTLTVTNTVSAPKTDERLAVTVLSVELPSGTPFTAVDDGCTGRRLIPEDTCSFGIRFAPTSTGKARTTMSLRLHHLSTSATYGPCEPPNKTFGQVRNYTQTFADLKQTVVTAAEWSGDLADDEGRLALLGVGWTRTGIDPGMAHPPATACGSSRRARGSRRAGG